LREILERKQISVVRSMLLHRCACVMRSKVEPMKEVAAMIRHNLAGIVTWAQTRQTNGFLEALNNRFQSAKRRARLHPHVHHFPHTHLSPTHICVSRIGSDAPRSCLRHQRGDIAHPSRMSSSLRILACQVAVLIEVHGPLRPCEAVVEDIDAAISLRRLRDPTSASSSAERSTGAMEVISSPAARTMATVSSAFSRLRSQPTTFSRVKGERGSTPLPAGSSGDQDDLARQPPHAFPPAAPRGTLRACPEALSNFVGDARAGNNMVSTL
jgi:hypothetical protein